MCAHSVLKFITFKDKYHFKILFLSFFFKFFYLEDKDSDGKEKRSKSKENAKKKEPASMFVINGDKESKSKKKGRYLTFLIEISYFIFKSFNFKKKNNKLFVIENKLSQIKGQIKFLPTKEFG